MGIQDRDYYRDGGGGFFDAWGRQGVTVWLIAVTCAVFFAQALTGNPDPVRSPLVEWGQYSGKGILEGEVWRLVTPLFLHVGVWHLFLNMLVLYWTGQRLGEEYGPREFLAFYLSAGVFASAARLGVELLGAPPSFGIGASGAVTAALVVFAFRYPRQQVLLFFILPMPMWAAAALFVVVDALGAAGVGQRGIGYVVHLGGALFGAVYYLTGLRLTALLGRPGRGASNRVRPRLRVAPAPPEEEDTPTPVAAGVGTAPRPRGAADPPEPPDEGFEARVDQVLAKLSKYGREGLTPEERAVLARASELYKKRRK